MSGVVQKIKDIIPGYNSLVKPVHFVRAVAAGVKYGFPAEDLRVIGVTGTNGKTTTCFLIWKMLNESGRKAGLMTTVAWGYKKLTPELNHMTTVDSFTLNERILKIKEAGAKYLVLEVTSHAMEQFRTLGVPVEVAVFTNLTHDHLDYHKTFKRYRAAKTKLFSKAKFGVVNADDKSARFFTREVKKYATYGINKGQIRAEEIKNGVMGVEYAVCEIGRGERIARGRESRGEGLTIHTQIPGRFNVYNSLAAVAVGRKLGLSDEEIKKGILALDTVEGRMNRVDEGQEFSVIVDYAHTPDALSKVFEAVKNEKGEFESGRIIVVHGGAGRRDESTREERGRILGREADVVIITEDDSRDERVETIIEQFVAGAKRAGKVEGRDLLTETDRGEAIRRAIEMAEKGDLVLILGKGHEKTILRGEMAVPFQDEKVARKWLKRRMSGERGEVAVLAKGERKVVKETSKGEKRKGKGRNDSGRGGAGDDENGGRGGVGHVVKKTETEVVERDKDGKRVAKGLRLKRKR